MSRSRTSPEALAPQARDRGLGGLLVILTAPSGTGKTTLAREVLAAEPELAFSVSHTTRPSRPGERDGLQYHFVDEPTFDRMVRRGAFSEWARVHAHRYGTSHAEIERLSSSGRDILFDIDPQGGEALMAIYPEAVTIFLVPPSMAALEARLRGRRTEREAPLGLRLANAAGEIAEAQRYQYLVVNDTIPRAVADFRAILRAERCRVSRHGDTLAQLAAPSRAPHRGHEPTGKENP